MDLVPLAYARQEQIGLSTRSLRTRGKNWT